MTTPLSIDAKKYLEICLKRSYWQFNEVFAFIIYCFEVGGDVLQRELVKTASSRYEETLRVERSQHNLVTDMVLELSRLPHFNAYAKLIDENQGTQIVRNHWIQSHPLPEKTNGRYGMPLFSAQFYGKKRDEIEAEIRERQARWLRSSSKTPTTRGL